MKIRPLNLQEKDREDDFWTLPGYVLFPWDGTIRFPLHTPPTTVLTSDSHFIITRPLRAKSTTLQDDFGRVLDLGGQIPEMVHHLVVEIWTRTNERKLAYQRANP